jgi:hypothetical protein
MTPKEPQVKKTAVEKWCRCGHKRGHHAQGDFSSACWVYMDTRGKKNYSYAKHGVATRCKCRSFRPLALKPPTRRGK